MQINFLDLKQHHDAIRGGVQDAIDQVIASNSFSGGAFVEKFEREFASFCECEFAVGTGNGTDAIWLTLLALGVGAGDEVITVPMTFMATAEAISFTGAKPVFVDINPRTYTMDPTQLERAITPRTKAIVPVHLFGQPADMESIMEIAFRHNLHVVEDACQAHGARYKGQRAGSMGIAGCFSFYPGKNLGAFGEAGAIVTNDETLHRKLQVLRDHGQRRKYHHSHIGWNGRMDGIQAAVLSVKLRYLEARNEQRRKVAGMYKQLLSCCPEISLPEEAFYSRHVYHVFAVKVQNRDYIMKELSNKGVVCGIHYPIPVHLQEAYAHLGCGVGAFPVAERCALEFLSLPMFPELTREQVEVVCNELTSFVGASESVRRE
ncbi:MAG: DegT/DnrJ/EryC1/StrS family aminotransferase [Limisphaerales bacterium]